MENQHNEVIQNKIESIDVLRGLAALMVCFFHFSNGINDFLPQTNVLRIISAWGYLGVEIFFIISGFVISYSLFKRNYTIHSFGIFFLKRIIRIEPPYLISIVLAITLKYLSAFITGNSENVFQFDFTNTLLHLGYLCAFFKQDWILPVYWTLAIEFQFYFFIAITYPFFIINKKKYVFYGFLVLINMPLLLGYTSNEYVFHHIPYFSLGIVFCRTLFMDKSYVEYWIGMLFLLGEIFYIHGLPPFLVSIAALLVMLFVTRGYAVFTFLGKISFSLYLVHLLVGTRILNLSINYTEDSALRTLLIFVAIGASILSAYIYYLIVEKPFIDLSKKLEYKKSEE